MGQHFITKGEITTIQPIVRCNVQNVNTLFDILGFVSTIRLYPLQSNEERALFNHGQALQKCRSLFSIEAHFPITVPPFPWCQVTRKC